MAITMKQCNKGHFYDQSQHVFCPLCHAPKGVMPTEFIGATPSPQPIRTPIPPTEMLGNVRGPKKGEANLGETIYGEQKQKGAIPVVGWLVCIEGADKGRDYRLHGEKNFLGRDPKMDVCISGDDTISRGKSAIVSFDPMNRRFKVIPGESHGLVYCNGETVDIPQILHPYDVIKIGQTQLLFVPLCGEHFQWA